VVTADLKAQTLADVFKGVDAVVHLAGVVSAVHDAEYTAANVVGTREVAIAARAAGARLVHVSSLAAAGPASPMAPRSEDDPSSPVTAYGVSKLQSEAEVRAIEGLSWVILRPGIVYGAGDRAMLPLFQAANRGVLPLVGRLSAAYSFVHVSDAVRAIDAAMKLPVSGETIFVGHPKPVTARDALNAIRTAVGKGRIVRVPTPVLWLAAIGGEISTAVSGRLAPINRRRYRELTAVGFVCRVDRLKERLGVVPLIGFEEGIARTAWWYRAEGWL
jgi:nucleoside-diphosphate-sugar epimerase